jgi:hypothetical protein
MSRRATDLSRTPVTDSAVQRAISAVRRPWHIALLAAIAAVLLTACSSSPSPQSLPDPAAAASDSAAPDTSPEAALPEPTPAEETTEFEPAPEPAVPEEAPSTVVSGHTYDPSGYPLEGVLLQFYIVPRGYGDVYQVYSGPDGGYGFELPEGVYNVLATYYFSDDPGDYADLVTDSGEINVPITVPPGLTIDWYLP